MHKLPFNFFKTGAAVTETVAATIAGAEAGSLVGRATASDVIFVKDKIAEHHWRKKMTPDAVLKKGFKKQLASKNPVTGQLEPYVGPDVSTKGLPVLHVKKDGSIR